ncbi:MAG: hypothetical protein ACI3T9_01350 [Romboutsia timonensis]
MMNLEKIKNKAVDLFLMPMYSTKAQIVIGIIVFAVFAAALITA